MTTTPITPTRNRLGEEESTAPLQQVLLRVEDVAALLGIGRSTVYELLRDQRLHSVKIGGSRRISRTAVDAFITDLEREQCHPADLGRVPESRR